jgi:PAS domain S-box-containing protein
MFNSLGIGKRFLIIFSYSLIITAGISGFICYMAEGAESAEESHLVLTPEERAWLDSHSMIRVHNEKDWTPFNFHKNGIPQGFSIDYMNLLADRIGFRVEYVTGPTWNEFLEMAKRKELDVMLNIAQSSERDKFLLFTDPYVQFAQALYTRVGSPQITSIEDLYGKKFAVPTGFYFEDLLKEHPQVKLVRVKNTAEAILAVSNGRADVMLDLMPVVNYLMKQLMVTNLKTGGGLEIDEGKPIYLRIGVRKDWEILQSILQKGMGTIGEEEIHNLRIKWLEFTEKRGIALTMEEQKWLASHPVLRLGVDPGWPPFEFVDQKGHYAGITSGFVEAISDRLNIKMTHVPGLTWPQAHEKFRAGEIDLHPGVIRTSEREKYMNFTKPYLSFPIVTASNKNTPSFGTIQDLKGYRVGVVKDYYTEDILRNDHPYLTLVTYATLAEALQDLDAGHIDAFIDNLVVINHEITRSGLENTRISAPTGYAVDLSLGVRKDLPELIGILNKAIDDISNQERATIKSTWMTDVEVKIRFDYKAIMAWAIPIGGSVILILVFVVIWNRRLGREIMERKRTEAQLEQAEERSRLLLESAGEGIFGVGEDGLVNFINPAGLKMLGFTAEEVIGQKIHPLIHHTRSDGTPYPMEECPMYLSLTQGTIGNQDDDVLWRKDGTSFHVEYTSVPIRKKDTIAGTVVVFWDITRQKHMEKELRQNVEELERFNKLAIGREKKMIQLKEEINQLLHQLHQEEKYKIVK